MKEKVANSIVNAAEELQEKTGDLIVAIDKIEDEEEKMIFRREFANLIALIEEKFVFEIRRRQRTD